MADTPDLAAGIAAADLSDDTPVAGTFEGEPVMLVRHGGRLCALAGKCTHLGASLAKGIVVDGQVRCPWHHARFDLDSGEAVGAPAFAPLDRFVVEEAGDTVRVTGKAPAPSPAAPPARDVGRVLIVGGGAAGHACADMLARAGAGATVTILSDDADAPYDRTFCSKNYLSGKADRAKTALPTPGLGRGPQPTVRTGVRVARLLPDEQAVETEGGERIAYDTLVLATGADPVVPPFDGADRDDVHVVRTLADADALIAAAEGKASAVVIGSSYVGLEVAASLTTRGLSVTVVSSDEVPLGTTAGPEIGGLVRQVHEGKGVTFRMGAKVTAWGGRTATLDDGSEVTGDLLVAGTGVKPRLELARDAGLTIAGEDAGGGVLVDDLLRSSHPNIHAIGDIASVPDPRLGHPIRVEHWVVAQRMGQWLARHLLGEVKGGYDALPFFWSGHYTTNLRYIGHAASTDDRRIDGDVAGKDVAVTFFGDGAEQAFLTCGRDRQSLEKEAAWER